MSKKETSRPRFLWFSFSAIFLGALFVGFQWGANSRPHELKEEAKGASALAGVPAADDWSALVEKNCRLSAGDFVNGACVCPISEGQTQESRYDRSTGYCKTEFGGPIGEADYADRGLPYGEFAFWRTIISNACEQSGGSMSYDRCTCDSSKKYDQSSGRCE